MIEIVFDGPPGPEAGRFVEVERDGRSVSVGEWARRHDGYWVLRIPDPDALARRVMTLRDVLGEAREFLEDLAGSTSGEGDKRLAKLLNQIERFGESPERAT